MHFKPECQLAGENETVIQCMSFPEIFPSSEEIPERLYQQQKDRNLYTAIFNCTKMAINHNFWVMHPDPNPLII
jgi:hypothetical protein